MATTTWTGTASNSYSDPNNWDNGVPNSITQGFINIAADVQVAANSTLSAGIAIGGVGLQTLEALGNLNYNGFSEISGNGVATDFNQHFVIKIDAGTLTNRANIATTAFNENGTISIAAGATLDNANNAGFGTIHAEGGSSLIISGAGTVADSNSIFAVGSGTTLSILSPVVADVFGNGTITVGNSSTVNLGASVATAITTQFADLSQHGFTGIPVGGLLQLPVANTFTSQIAGFFNPAYTIDLVGAASGAFKAPDLTFSETGGIATLVVTAHTFNPGNGVVATLTFKDPTGRYSSFNPTTGGFSISADSGVGYNINTAIVACFASGTRIRTDRGEVAVEALGVGDHVQSALGGTAPVVWLGHRSIDCARHPRPGDVWPVRVEAHAFGPGQPSRDLLLSPDHSVHVQTAGGAALIPIRYLVNGASIAQIEMERVTYWHVELPAHDVLLAEGLECESYLDTGNRCAFAGEMVTAVHPDFALRVWEAESCARLLVDGPELALVRAMLLARAAEIGHAMTDDAELHLVADGRVIHPQADGHLHRFVLPAGTRAVRLVSRSQAPADIGADTADHRMLGVAVAAIMVDGVAIALDGPELGRGWHAPEAGWRWTGGDAEMNVAGAREIAVSVAMSARYWRRPAATGRLAA